ncbi:hypothetical protein CGRA01v4_01051 [Colletotrichum graminicola]|nr:hypothetical protein CGRA01v4_01051 [Colletotrichum graminicola]
MPANSSAAVVALAVAVVPLPLRKKVLSYRLLLSRRIGRNKKAPTCTLKSGWPEQSRVC